MSDDSEKVFLPAARVRERYGGISDMSLWRWTKNPQTGFPQPIFINNRRYWRLHDLENWERFRASDQGRTPQLAP